MDISCSLDDLKAKGIDLSQIIEIDFSRTNESWLDVTSSSICVDDSDVEKEKRFYECNVCKKSFKLLTKLKRHAHRMHPGKRAVLKKSISSRKLICPNFVKQNVNPNILKTVAENGPQCDLCRKSFLSQDSRDKHLVSFFSRLNNMIRKLSVSNLCLKLQYLFIFSVSSQTSIAIYNCSLIVMSLLNYLHFNQD